jgi:Bacterial Ig-like domain (group 3)
MPHYTQGSTRVVLQQPDLTNFQGNGSVVLDSRRTRPLWFDGRFMAARDLEREQNYFLQREADLGQAAGFDVMNGLLVDQAVVNGRPDAQTVVIHAGSGITPAGEMVTVSSDLTIALSSIPVEQTRNVQFGLSATPQQPAQKRTGLYVIALRPVEFTANPITAYPTTVQGPRSTHDGDIVEATAVVLLPYPNPASNFAASLQQAAIARQIFLTGNPTALPDSVLPLALVSLNQGAISWLNPYLVRRDTGPQYSGVRFGLTDPATQQAFLMQYDMQLQAAVAARNASGLKANIAATDYFQALPAGGRFPLDAIDTGAFSQVFFPQEMDVRLSIIPSEELPALLEDSMSLPPIDLTLPAGSYTNMAVFAFVPVPLESFAALKTSLPQVPLNPTLPQVLANRSPFQLLQLYRGAVTFSTAPSIANSAWATAIGSQTYGFYLRRRSDPTFVTFETPLSLTVTSSADPSVEGQAVTFTVNVTPASATGSVGFMDGPTTVGVATLSGGAASFSTSSLSVGAHSITAVYGGDAINAANSSPVLIQTVNKAPSAVALISSPDPSTVGQAVTFTAHVSPASATGSVQFFDSKTLLGAITLSGGNATLTVSSLALGAHSVTAVYSGDGNFATSTSQPVVQTVATALSSVTLTSSANPSTIGHAVTFTAQVTPATATGSVQFLDGGAALGTATLSGGVATFSTTSLAAGSHSITASYGGDANAGPGVSVAVSQVIALVTSSVTISSSANPSTLGQSVTFTAQVSPNTATGSIRFMDGATVLATVALSGGAATSPLLSNLTAGAHSITAVYSGDSIEAPSTSAPVTQTVSKLATGVTLTSSLNPSVVGQSVTLTAHVSPASATGSVQFFDGTTSLGTATVSGGAATLAVSSLTGGAHSLTAAYSGDGSNAASTSPPLAQTVNQTNTSVTLSSSLNPSTFGQTVTLTATVTPATATGSVQFTDGSTSLGAATLSGGTASVSVTTLAVGAHPITATYNGDANNSASVSAPLSLTVNKVASTVTVTSSQNPSSFGPTVTMTATVTPSSATGNVQFLDGTTNLGVAALSGGVAALAFSPAVGVHSITVVYSGDANDSGSTSTPLTQTVNKTPTSVSLTASAPTTILSVAVTFTARVTPSSATGSVQFLDSGKALGTSNLSGGTATLTVTTLAAGSHSITASYTGDTNDAASSSDPLTHSVILNVTVTIRPTLTIRPTGTLRLGESLNPITRLIP